MSPANDKDDEATSAPPTPARRVRDAAEVESIHALLLEPAFPVSELVTAQWLTNAVTSGDASVLVSEDASGPVATAVTERLGRSGSVLLSYFATRADRRGRGVGSQLFTQMLDAVRLQDAPSLIVAEVERPDSHTGSVEHGDPTARLRFYGRHGARALDLPYFQPPIRDQARAVHGMLLLALWVEPALLLGSPDEAAVAGAGPVADAIDSILGSPTPHETVESSVLRAAAGADSVRLYAVEDYLRIASSR